MYFCNNNFYFTYKNMNSVLRGAARCGFDVDSRPNVHRMNENAARRDLQRTVTGGINDDDLLNWLMGEYGDVFKCLMDEMQDAPEDELADVTTHVPFAISRVRQGLLKDPFYKDRVLHNAEARIEKPNMDLVQFEMQELDDGKTAAVIKFNDHKRRNAMTEEMAIVFKRTVAEVAEAKPDVIIVIGEGSCFSSGGDKNMIHERIYDKSSTVNQIEMRAFYDAFLGIRDLGIPIIAAINGPASGAGLGFACACDYRVSEEGVRGLGVPFKKLGLYPGMGCTFFLKHLIVNHAKTNPLRRLLEKDALKDVKWLFDSGESIDAEFAHGIGLVDEVVGKGQLMERALEMAQEVSEQDRDEVLDRRPPQGQINQALCREAYLQGLSFKRPAAREGYQSMFGR